MPIAPTVSRRRRARPLSRVLLESAAAGVGGTAAMTASSTLEMRLRGRPPSPAPVDAVERLLGRPVPEHLRGVVGSAAHLATGLTFGPPRVLLDRLGVPDPAATALFALVVWTPDAVVVPALGVTDPPWRWGAAEVAISAWHHIAYALGASAALAAARRLARNEPRPGGVHRPQLSQRPGEDHDASAGP